MSKEDVRFPVTEEHINFWNQIKIATEKLNDPNCTDEWVLKVKANHTPSYTKEVFY